MHHKDTETLCEVRRMTAEYVSEETEYWIWIYTFFPRQDYNVDATLLVEYIVWLHFCDFSQTCIS